jgi:predicted dehydrogenase
LEWLARFQEAYVAETADWVDSLLNQRRFSGASAWDGFATLCVTDACVQSLNSGQPVAVSLPPQPDLRLVTRFAGISSAGKA